METLVAFLFAVIITSFFVSRYVKNLKKVTAQARDSAEKGKLFSGGPRGMHPHIDITNCIGCAACTLVCPEGDVLAMIGRAGSHRQRTQMYWPQPLRGSMSRGRDHHGDGQPKHERRHALPDAGL